MCVSISCDSDDDDMDTSKGKLEELCPTTAWRRCLVPCTLLLHVWPQSMHTHKVPRRGYSPMHPVIEQFEFE